MSDPDDWEDDWEEDEALDDELYRGEDITDFLLDPDRC